MKLILLLLFPIFLFSSNLSYQTFYYEDTKSLEFQDIKKQDFTHFETKSLFKGYNFNDIWIKIQVKNKSNKNLKQILSLSNPTLDYVDFYVNDTLKTETGDHRNNANRAILDIYFSFPIQIEKQSEKTYYLRLQTKNSFALLSFALLPPFQQKVNMNISP